MSSRNLIKTMRTALAFALTAGTLTFAAQTAMAAIIASDDFKYPLGELNTQNGGSGWNGAWTSNTVATQIVDPAVDLLDDRALQFSGNQDNAAYRLLGSTFSGDQLYVDFFVQIDSGMLTGNDFLSLWLDTSTAGAHTNRPNLGYDNDSFIFGPQGCHSQIGAA